MALFGSRQLSLIKLLHKQSCFSNKATFGLVNEFKNSKYAIIYSNNEQVRYTSTTPKKGNAFAFEYSTELQNDLQNINKTLDLSFNDSKTAFQSKSNFELFRAYVVFQLCGINFLLDHQKTLLDLSKKILGRNLFNKLMKNTFYGHFVAGEDQNEIRGNVEKMRNYGVKAILDYSAEEDLQEQKSSKSENLVEEINNRTVYEQSELQSEKNLKIFMDCVDTVENVSQTTGLAAIKITSLIRPALLLKFSSLVDQITASEKKAATHSNIFNLQSILSKNIDELEKLFNKNQSLKFSQSELGELKNMFSRLNDLGKHALKKKVRMFVDAEQTYFQGAIRRVTNELMREFNIEQTTFLNTYQNYLKNAKTCLVEDMELANKEGYCFGAKLVRGAYMEQERERAFNMGYEDPINENFDATTKMYESSLMHSLEEIKKKPGFVNIMVASHNEDTIRFAIEKMDEFGIRPNDNYICFGQLYGMCDFISFYLGESGYSAFKYVPYGPVEEVLPYLSRRMTENGKGLFEKLDKEKKLIATEIKRRFDNLEFL